uniref:IRF tryptophan pentad repeat domain-containing protein n=1 Tax=Periophthalmus magnuspinnatus TaxID=409849 RepID=A0A3B3ZS70_9GOBI
MNLNQDGLSVSCGNGKLRQWLIDQIDSGRYPGLVWENDEKSIFRIPWKHAGKQDYNREEDAALFKAWALFKGKYKEGVDKPDPPTWKTRLRCALNKSNDFDELVERSQLDISEPYKVYRIIPEGAKKGTFEEAKKHWRDFASSDQQPLPPPPFPPHHHHELQYHYPSALGRPWPTPHSENGFQLSFHTYLSESQPPVYAMDPNAVTDFSLHVSLFYRESLVKEVTTTSPDGCRISSSASSSSSSPSSSPRPDDRVSVGPEVILFPFPYPESHRQGADMLPSVLERGVLLWMAPDGMYAKRLCQSRVYWEGPLAPYTDKPNKLEKEQPCKLFDTQQFLIELHDFVHNGRSPPRHQIVLCFGDEYPDPQRTRKLITAQVEPVFARKLFIYYQQNNGPYLRTYDHNQQPNPAPTLDYTSQRPLQHIQE